MTQESKQLLLKDLCARIPYHTFVQLNPGAYNKPETCILTGVHGEKIHLNVDSDPFRIDHIKPYLRSMSSMTEEEYIHYCETREWKYVDDDHYEYFDTLKTFNWLLEHHFDFRTDPSTNKTLIESGLAIEAKEGMYK